MNSDIEALVEAESRKEWAQTSEAIRKDSQSVSPDEAAPAAEVDPMADIDDTEQENENL